MEALYAKLYDKYNKLKTKIYSELEERTKEQEAKFLDCISAGEELIQDLKNENGRLRLQVKDLSSKVNLPRSSKEELCVAGYQKLLLEEKQKNELLSEEVERLQMLHQEGLSLVSKGGKIDAPHGSSSRRITKKRSRESAVESGLPDSCSKRMARSHSHSHEPRVRGQGKVMPDGGFDEAVVKESAEPLSNKTVLNGGLRYDQWPECCKGNSNGAGGDINDQGQAKCIFQPLVEYLLRMKFSTKSLTEGTGISLVHQSSGYSFSLTWEKEGAGGECWLMYDVSSLGTFQIIAPEWMRETIKFSTNMCPVFFERVARVIDHHC